MQWSSACANGHARTPTKVHEVCQNYLTSGLTSKRQAPVECESPSEICDLVAASQARVFSEECGSVKESQGVGPVPLPTAHLDRSFDVSRRNVIENSLLRRRAARALAVQRFYPTVLGRSSRV